MSTKFKIKSFYTGIMKLRIGKSMFGFFDSIADMQFFYSVLFHKTT